MAVLVPPGSSSAGHVGEGAYIDMHWLGRSTKIEGSGMLYPLPGLTGVGSAANRLFFPNSTGIELPGDSYSGGALLYARPTRTSITSGGLAPDPNNRMELWWQTTTDTTGASGWTTRPALDARQSVITWDPGGTDQKETIFRLPFDASELSGAVRLRIVVGLDNETTRWQFVGFLGFHRGVTYVYPEHST